VPFFYPPKKGPPGKNFKKKPKFSPPRPPPPPQKKKKRVGTITKRLLGIPSHSSVVAITVTLAQMICEVIDHNG